MYVLYYCSRLDNIVLLFPLCLFAIRFDYCDNYQYERGVVEHNLVLQWKDSVDKSVNERSSLKMGTPRFFAL